MLQHRSLDKNTPVPLWFQLERLIIEEIENGNYPVGSMIPTEKEISQMFDISRTTVRQAIIDLVRQERLYRIKSKGTFVAQPRISQSFIQSIKSFADDVSEAGGVPSTEVLDLKVVELPEEIAFDMGMAVGSKAVYLYRKRYIDNAAILRVETYLPYDLCSFLMDHDFNHESLYAVLSTHPETKVRHIVRTCEARLANAEDVAVLDVKKRSPIQFFVSMGYNQDKKLIEYSIAYYRGDKSKFRVEVYQD